MAGLRFDPEYAKVLEAFQTGEGPPIYNNVLELRGATDIALTMGMAGLPPSSDLKKDTFKVQSYDGAEILVTRFANDKVLSSSTPTAAVVYVHGGGFVCGSVDIYAPAITYYANQSDVPFFAVGYRLAPENPAPAGLEDCYAAVEYVSEHSKELNVDAAKLAVMGDSAGGCLSAATALIARDRELSPPLAKQILLYPTLDNRTVSADEAVENFYIWKAYQNVMAWNAYLGKTKDGKVDEDLESLVVPTRAKSLKGLPPTYLEVGTLDLFRDESLDYVSRLSKEGNEVEFHLWPALPHGYEYAPGTSWQTRGMESRMSAIKRVGV